VPKSDDDSAKAWMQAKILSALLVDRVLLEGSFFPLGICALMKSAAGMCLWKCATRCAPSWHPR